MKKHVFIGMFCVLLLLVSCGKYKKPTEVDFYVDFTTSSTVGGNLTFSSGYVIVEEFDFDGDRERGDDVRFVRKFDNGLLIPFSSSNPVTELDFTIPQGEFKRIDIELETFDNNDPCIFVEGTYTYQNNSTIPFRFEFEDSEKFEVRAEDNNGGNIVLDKDVLSKAKIVFDPAYWFAPIPISNFENAAVSSVGGVNTIVVNKNENEAIYDIVVNRIEESLLVVFNF